MNILVSYAYLKPLVRDFIQRTGNDVTRVLMDSGAFTTYTMGAPVSLGEYVYELRGLQDRLFDYIMLDVIRDREATKRNLETMARVGLYPMPVWTTDSSVDDLRFLQKFVPDKLCVSGGVTEKIHWYGPRLKEAREVLGPEAFIHALGFTTKHTASCPINSCDSSSYVAGSKYGVLAGYHPEFGLRNIPFRKIREKGFSASPDWVQKIVIDSDLPRELFETKPEGSLFSPLYLLTLSAWIDFARDLKRHGVRMFFVVTYGHELPLLATVCNNKHGSKLDWETIAKEGPLARRVIKTDMASFVEYFKRGTEKQELLW